MLLQYSDPTHYLHPLPSEIYLLFWHYSPVLGHAYYSQNYASIFGQSLLLSTLDMITYYEYALR